MPVEHIKKSFFPVDAVCAEYLTKWHNTKDNAEILALIQKELHKDL